MKCDNCVNDAMYLVSDPGANPVSYCGDCLPASLSTRAAEGQFEIPVAEPVKAAKSKKTAEPVEVEETPAE
jgi:hypothetical protein